MKSYIQERNNNRFTVNTVKVVIKDKVLNISDKKIKKALTLALNKVPKHLLFNLDIIYIGQFSFLKKRKLQALYKDSSVWMTNEYTKPYDMVDDLVHEVAHSVEETHESLIYGDKKIEKEFIEKRKVLWQILRDQDFKVELHNFLNPEYQQDLDMFFYNEIGYPMLSMLSNQIFYSPYAATSLREYFANGFEAFFMKEEVHRLKKISPILFLKINDLLNLKED